MTMGTQFAVFRMGTGDCCAASGCLLITFAAGIAF
jgi:hypothetical protein